MHKLIYTAFFIFLLNVPILAFSQDVMTPVPPAVFGTATPAVSADAGKDSDDSTTRETAIECATAQIAESAGGQHRALANPLSAAFKAGECSGKLETYMLAIKSQNPACFPKISLEEAISLFVKWADAHPDGLAGNYLLGFKAAFEDAVPCLKK